MEGKATEQKDRGLWLYAPGFRNYACSHCHEETEWRYKTCPGCGREMLNGWKEVEGNAIDRR